MHPERTPEQLHVDAIVVDGHADTPQRFVDEAWPFSGELGNGHLNLDAARAGGLTAQFFAIWPEPTAWRGRYAFRTLQLIDGVLEQVRRHPDAMRLGLTPEDIRAAKRDGVFCALMGIEGGHAIENDLGLLRLYHRLGVRYMTLTWNNSNEWADSSGDEHDTSVPHHGGLSAFGREVIAEMNRLGMMIDLSHAADTAFWDTLRVSRAPVIASHSNARALTDCARNLTDEQLRAVAESDGIVMANFYPAFLDEGWSNAWAATEPERERLRASSKLDDSYGAGLELDRRFFREQFSRDQARVRFDALLDHIEHIAAIAGRDHVGLGSDFDGFGVLPEGIDSAADLPKITAGLAARGWSETALRKLLGENLLRVFGRVQALAV